MVSFAYWEMQYRHSLCDIMDSRLPKLGPAHPHGQTFHVDGCCTNPPLHIWTIKISEWLMFMAQQLLVYIFGLLILTRLHVLLRGLCCQLYATTLPSYTLCSSFLPTAQFFLTTASSCLLLWPSWFLSLVV